MKSIALLALILPLVAGSASAAGLLDGKTYSGVVGARGKAADSKDELVFANGTLHSTACDAYGFEPGAYTAVQNGDVVRFTATTHSKSQGSIEWSGTVRNGQIEGTFTWKKWGGLVRRNYWIKASAR